MTFELEALDSVENVRCDIAFQTFHGIRFSGDVLFHTSNSSLKQSLRLMNKSINFHTF